MPIHQIPYMLWNYTANFYTIAWLGLTEFCIPLIFSLLGRAITRTLLNGPLCILRGSPGFAWLTNSRPYANGSPQYYPTPMPYLFPSFWPPWACPNISTCTQFQCWGPTSALLLLSFPLPEHPFPGSTHPSRLDSNPTLLHHSPWGFLSSPHTYHPRLPVFILYYLVHHIFASFSCFLFSLTYVRNS